ncbi:hypothetical protein [Ureibacillus sinduriensis]|uniref:Uncharacterized protein n=1 Tax=Ureibacillus sinduriensis BLB-1 = JCM 15800 TaxID=1384057 RepID=A0A0A3I100_9BACL|nr:hypothetical protein [Ureibacillus sinduriensis]KGR76288.1 hypothetical protein CD33_07010 [Ureibacillus sinduriensis BLB-1 = JCM 15800]
MKKFILPLVAFWILAAIFIIYPEFKTRNFIDAFVTSLDNTEEVIQGIAIRKDGKIEALLEPSDKQYDEVLSALKEWEVKRVPFKEADFDQEKYKLAIQNNARSLTGLNIVIYKDGMIDIRGKEYKLVNGSSIEELIEVAK